MGGCTDGSGCVDSFGGRGCVLMEATVLAVAVVVVLTLC